MARQCKECGKNVPYVRKGRILKGKQLRRLGGYLISLCPYCYNMRFPKRKMWNLPACRHGSEKVLTPSDRRYLKSRQFEGIEVWLWEPEFYYEWLDALYD